tara:strand:- start:224 stop:367 length:144 start_codon:yes stop_codon:yes gene_type:complete
MQKELQIFTSLQRQQKPIDKDTLADLEAQTIKEHALRSLIKEILRNA